MIKISLKAILVTLSLLVTVPALLASRAGTGTLDPDWIWHSSFDDGIRKVIDTPTRVYFFVHQRPYFISSEYKGYYKQPSGAIFFLDKSNPEAGIQDYHHFAAFSGLDMRLFAVNPDNDMKVIAYHDGGIDLIDADNKVTYISVIKNRPLPGATVINAINIDRGNGDIRISTNQGFLHLNKEGKVITYAEYGKKVSDICRVGDRIIAIIAGRLYEAPATANLTRLDSFQEIPGVTGDTPTYLMPLTDTSLAYLNEGNAIIGMSHNGTSWSVATITSDGGISESNGTILVAHKQDHSVIPTADGYYLASDGKAYFVKKPAEAGAMPSVTAIDLVSGSSRYSSSYDGKTVWSYTNRGKFFSTTYPDRTSSEAIRPAAPLFTQDVRFIYSPEHGFLSVNIDPQKRADIATPRFPALLTAYRDGQWVNLSQTYNIPDVISENSTYMSTFNANIHHFPVADPVGICLDPIFKDIMHYGSIWDGTAAVNLDNPRKMPVMYLSSINGMSSLPVYTFTNGNCGWASNNGNYTGMCIAGYDVDGNIWLYRSTAMSISPTPKTHELWYWTPDARREALVNSDASKYKPWGVIKFDMPNDPSAFLYAKTLLHPLNANKIMLYSQGCGANITIVDYNGTLEDSSDDDIKMFSKIMLPSGASGNPGYVNDFIENPITGEIVICTRNETFVINSDAEVTDGRINGRNLSVPSETGSSYDFLSPMICNSACFDEYGRLWCAIASGGVIGFSPDYSRVIAYYNTDNSPLLSNNIHGLGWNPDTKSLFISTDCGIVEVKVDSYSVAADSSGTASDALQAPFATPETVTPDYTGTVAVHNVPAVTTLRVTDSRGRLIRSLPASESGVTYWDLLDNSGKRVPTGRYSIEDATGDSDFRAISVTVVR